MPLFSRLRKLNRNKNKAPRKLSQPIVFDLTSHDDDVKSESGSLSENQSAARLTPSKDEVIYVEVDTDEDGLDQEPVIEDIYSTVKRDRTPRCIKIIYDNVIVKDDRDSETSSQPYYEWYFGSISRTQAEQMMADEVRKTIMDNRKPTDGIFLVRKRTGERHGNFAITTICDGGKNVIHHLLTQPGSTEPGTLADYRFNNKRLKGCKSLEKAVAALSSPAVVSALGYDKPVIVQPLERPANQSG